MIINQKTHIPVPEIGMRDKEKRMKKHIYDKENGLSYTLTGDYYLPDLLPPQGETPNYGKYGSLRLRYLKEYKRGMYVSMLTQGKLVKHLNTVDKEASESMEYLIQSMKQQHGITEQLKAEDQMKWVGLMNNIKSAAEEIVLKELVYI